MDEQSHPETSNITGPVDPEQGAQPGAGPTFVFYGDPERGGGLVIAFHAMGITATIPDVTLHEPSEPRE